MERAPLTTHVKSDDVEMTGEHACAKPPVGSGGQPGADSGGVSQGPILREVTLPSGALGVIFVKNYIKELHEWSPLLGHVQPGERVVAFTREDGSMIECTGMSGAALAHKQLSPTTLEALLSSARRITPPFFSRAWKMTVPRRGP